MNFVKFTPPKLLGYTLPPCCPYGTCVPEGVTEAVGALLAVSGWVGAGVVTEGVERFTGALCWLGTGTGVEEVDAGSFFGFGFGFEEEGVTVTYTFTTFTTSCVVTTTTVEGTGRGVLTTATGTVATTGCGEGTATGTEEVIAIPALPPNTPNTNAAATTNQPRRWPFHGPS